MFATPAFEFGTVPFDRLPAAAWALIALALAFDYLNGFHDAANSVATVVSTRVLRPLAAVAWAAFFNFAAFLVFRTAVAATIGEDIVDPHVVTYRLIAAALIAACAWALLTWWLAPADEQLARPDRRPGRRGPDARRPLGPALGRHRQDGGVHRAGAAAGHGLRTRLRRDRVPARPPLDAAPRPRVLPPRPARLGRALQPRPRRQRRPEDDGDHPRAPDRLGARRGVHRPDRGADRGGARLPPGDGAWARSAAAGGSSGRWASGC